VSEQFVRPYEDSTDMVANTKGTYRFRVAVSNRRWSPDYGHLTPVEPTYTVMLPHQCDTWLIVQSKDKAEASVRLTAFINEAIEALALLNEAPE